MYVLLRVPVVALVCLLACNPGEATETEGTGATSGGPGSTSEVATTAGPGTMSSTDPSVDPTGCDSVCECGDGIVTPPEECEPHEDGCTPSCTLNVCGDSWVEPGVEECDDGNEDNSDECTNECRFAVCGDGFVQGDEECDDGNLTETDACTTQCLDAVCGDGFVYEGVEQCDDGNNLDDACSNTCIVQEVRSGHAGPTHSGAILDDGTIKLWGQNPGTFGLGDDNHRGDNTNEMGANLPRIDLGDIAPVVQLSLGFRSQCVVDEAGELRCWGENDWGKLGLGHLDVIGDEIEEMGNALLPTDLGAPVLQVATSSGHTCALLQDGGVKCWGQDGAGQLGLGGTQTLCDLIPCRGSDPSHMGDALPYVDLGAGQTAIGIAVDGGCSCALLASGDVKCWGVALGAGQGSDEPIGDEPGEMGDALPPIILGAKATQVSTHSSTSCAVLEGGAVKCWGNNNNGQLGLGHTDRIGDEPGEMAALQPIDLGQDFVATQLDVGLNFVCAVSQAGDVKCWGQGFLGKLGLGDTEDRGDEPGEMGDALPKIELGGPAIWVESGFAHSCAQLSDTSLKCWGTGNHGRLGTGNSTDLGDDPGEMGANLPRVKLYSDSW